MLFGDPSIFAIEASLDPQAKNTAVYGRMRVFCQGQPMGNFAESNCALFPAYQGLDRILKRLRAGDLRHQTIEGLAHANSHQVLAEALFGEIAGDIESCPDGLWDHSFLNNWGPQFDGLPHTFIRSSGTSTVISQGASLAEATIGILKIPTDIVLNVLDEFCGWYELQEQTCTQPK